MKITIIHSGGESTYLFGLVSGLSKIEGLLIDVIDSDKSIGAFDHLKNVTFYNYRGSLDPNVSTSKKYKRIVKYYIRLIAYAAKSKAKIFHIQWPNKFLFFDRTLLNIYYKLNGKKIVFTAHNINKQKRDNQDSAFNRFSLKLFYNLVNSIIVHNDKMKKELSNDFKISSNKIFVNRIGLNIKVPKSEMNRNEARKLLNVSKDKKLILFFGGINEYKGVDILIESFSKAVAERNDLLLLIAGASRNDNYVSILKELISKYNLGGKCITHFKFIPEDSVEIYFKSADCLVLPYRSIFQSGLHVLSYAYGLPVIATDVGSFKDEDVLVGKSGYICKPEDVEDLKNTILKYFDSDLFFNLEKQRKEIIEWAENIYSWDKIAVKTYKIYEQLVNS